MINIDTNLRDEVRSYTKEVRRNAKDAYRLYIAIMDKFFELEENDDRDGTNELETLLEEKSIEWIAKEYGLV